MFFFYELPFVGFAFVVVDLVCNIYFYVHIFKSVHIIFHCSSFIMLCLLISSHTDAKRKRWQTVRDHLKWPNFHYSAFGSYFIFRFRFFLMLMMMLFSSKRFLSVQCPQKSLFLSVWWENWTNKKNVQQRKLCVSLLLLHGLKQTVK